MAYSISVLVESVPKCTAARGYSPAMGATGDPVPHPAALIDWPLGQLMRICDLDHADPAVRRRLAELGLRRGTRLTILHRTAGGGRVVAAGDLRLALDKRVAASLLVVTDTDERPSGPPATRRP